MTLIAGADEVAAMMQAEPCLTYMCTSELVAELLGVRTIGATVDTGGSSNYLNGTLVKTSELGGRAVTLSAYFNSPLDSLTANRRYAIGIYSDNGGKPGQLLGVTTNTGTIVVGWNTLSASIQLQPSMSYWLMVNNNGRSSAVNFLSYDTKPGQGAWSTFPVAFGTWPQTFDAVVTNTAFSIFGTLLP